MTEIPLKVVCNACQGEGVLSTGQTFVLAGRIHPLLTRCAACEGKGTLMTWADLHQFTQMLHAIAAETQAE
jgi:DnaJ-class molecular chaperone